MIERDSTFSRLLRAAWNEALAPEAEKLLGEVSPEERSRAAFMIANLCGVEAPAGYPETLSSGEWARALAEAVSSDSGREKTVVSCGSCSNHECRDAKIGAPCASSCPFHAIMIDRKTDGLSIDHEKCVGCGLCVEACPDGILQDLVEFIPATNLAKNGRPVVAAVAPAIVGQFGEAATIERLRAAFKKLGYVDMVEVAFFADMLTMKEAAEFDAHVLDKDDFLISSCCCPIWVAMLRRVYRELVKYVSPSVSPMVAAGRVLKRLRPECSVVFVGPCIAKKAEAKDPDVAGAIDHVFTFAEIREVFAAAGIDPASLEGESSFEYSSRGGRLYARSGGVSIAVTEAVEALYPAKSPLMKTAKADGVPACKELLDRIRSGDVTASFIEGMGCVGGCVGGPKAIIAKEAGLGFVDRFAESTEIRVATQSSCMEEILRRIGVSDVKNFRDPDTARPFEREF
jgi:iron only hydrogenase large subunit-like protein